MSPNLHRPSHACDGAPSVLKCDTLVQFSSSTHAASCGECCSRFPAGMVVAVTRNYGDMEIQAPLARRHRGISQNGNGLLKIAITTHTKLVRRSLFCNLQSLCTCESYLHSSRALLWQLRLRGLTFLDCLTFYLRPRRHTATTVNFLPLTALALGPSIPKH